MCNYTKPKQPLAIGEFHAEPSSTAMTCGRKQSDVLSEKWNRVQTGSELLERFLARGRREAIGGIENLCSNVNVSCSCQEDSRSSHDPMHSGVDVALLREWFVPGSAGVIAAPPRPARNCLDRLHHDVSLFTDGNEATEDCCIMGILHHEIIVGEHDGVEVESFETAKMRRSDLAPVASDANKANQALLTRFDTSFQRTLRT